MPGGAPHLLAAAVHVPGCDAAAEPVAGTDPLEAAERRGVKERSADRVDVRVAEDEVETAAGAAFSSRACGAAPAATPAQRSASAATSINPRRAMGAKTANVA